MIKVRLRTEYISGQPPAYVYSSAKVRRRLILAKTSVSNQIKFRQDFSSFMFGRYPTLSPRFKKRKTKRHHPLVSPRFVRKREMRCVCDLCKEDRARNAACPYDFSTNIRLDYEYQHIYDSNPSIATLTFYNDTDFMTFVMIAPSNSWYLV